MRKYITLKLTLLVFVVLLSSHIFCPHSQAGLKGGCAKVNITPPIGIWLSGYSRRDRASDDIVDELYARAMVLDDGQNTIAIVCNDLVGVPLGITTEIRRIIEEKTGIPEKSVLICATHTHYGPMIRKRKIYNNRMVDKSYVQTLIKNIAGSVLIAHKNMKEVRVGAAKGKVPEIVYNRRTKMPDGSVRVTWGIPYNESEVTFGPTDPEVCVLRVEDMNGEIICSLVNFACHPTSEGIFADVLYSVSADFPGYAARVVEQIEGGICLFAQGTGGNMAAITRLRERRNPRLQMGNALGGEALRRLQFVRTSNDVTLKSLKKDINFPTKKTLPDDSIMDDNKLKNDLTTEIQVFKIGDIYILGLPGEVLAEIGLEIKKKASIENLFIISLSNDVCGYVCHSEAYEEGGYESTTATILAKGAGEIMIKEALNIINQMKQSK